MKNKICKMYLALTYTLTGCGVAQAECLQPRSNKEWFPYNAYYLNKIEDKLGVTVEDTTEDLEQRTGERFLHSAPVADMDIKIIYGDLEENVIGLATIWNNHCVITMSNKLRKSSIWDKDDFAGVLRHEIGHCFGMDHSADPNSVMYWQYNPAIHLTDKAIENFTKDLKKFRDDHR